jgi:hypothetical protein
MQEAHEMEDLSSQKGLAASFRYVGEIDHQQVPKYLNLHILSCYLRPSP